MTRTFIGSLALLSALALSTAYCGGDDDDDNNVGGSGGAGGSAGVPSGGTGGGGGVIVGEKIPRLLASDAEFSTMNTVLNALDAEGKAAVQGAVATLFAPRNEAFTALGSGCALAISGDRAIASQFFRYHVLTESVVSSDLNDGQTVEKATALGPTLTVTKTAGKLASVNGTAQIVDADIIAANGAIHKIDKLLVPPGTTLPPACQRGVAGASGASGAGGQGGAGGGGQGGAGAGGGGQGGASAGAGGQGGV
ncbi:MAG: fasciclin domain-containing protein [Polyangiaceae bacterium]|nr:fasciclin domain-containing protein [Polyangiaceae bacterium]